MHTMKSAAIAATYQQPSLKTTPPVILERLYQNSDVETMVYGKVVHGERSKL
jgi:hypothetical protein